MNLKPFLPVAVPLSFLALILTVGLGGPSAQSAPPAPLNSRAHTEWVAKSLKAIQAIQPGTARREVLKVMTVEGGTSSRTVRTYVYRECPYIKVTIQFEPAELFGRGESPEDRVVTISQPFLQWSIMD